MVSSPPATLVIVGAGVSACALAARLRRLGWRGSITLVEAGQGVGGRAASRRSRQDPGWALDHGAPFLSLEGAEPPELLDPLRAIDRIRPWPDGDDRGAEPALRQLEADGSLSGLPGPFADAGTLLRGWPTMADLAGGMLELAEAARQPGGPAAGAPALQRRHGVRIERLERRQGLWRLGDRDGESVASGRWLVLSGTLLAHPRCRALLGCPEVPLAAANRDLGDPELARALGAIAALRLDPRLALLLRLEGELAALWRRLPFRHLWFSDGARQRWGLERISVQPHADGRCGVVVHARPDALVACGRLAPQAAQGDPAAESAEIDAMRQALGDALTPWITAADLPALQTCQRMRWGGAFPLAPGLEREAMVCPASQVALCGDATGGEGFARIEGAWRSGEWLAQRLLPALQALER